jgi:hypothetical protein
MSLLAVFDESERLLTGDQGRILDVLLGEDAVSDEALRDWAAAVDLDNIDLASYRLVPALYARVGSQPVLRSLSGRMKGIYRYCFCRNNRFLNAVRPVCRALVSAGVDFIVFKGMSSLLQYHSSAALRSFGDCDILVRWRDKDRAEGVLAACGFRYRYDAKKKLEDQHSHDFVDATGNGLDLHWYSLLESRGEGVDDGFWSRSRFIEWKGLRLRVLAPEDEFLVAGVSGIREIGGIRELHAHFDWLYDAWLILKATPDFDWRLLREELCRRKLQLSSIGAIALMHRFIPHFPSALVEELFRQEICSLAERRVAENRVFGLDPATDLKLTAAVSSPDLPRFGFERIFYKDRRARVARSGNVIRHMHYCTHEDGSVSHLSFHRDIRAFLHRIFHVVDRKALRGARNHARRSENVELRLPPGALRVSAKESRQIEAARLDVDSQLLRFATPEVSHQSVAVRITNRGRRPWHVFASDDSMFGLSYHLAAANGDMVRWDFPRQYFLTPVRNQVVMLLPGDSVQVDLDILLPPMPGRYEARLDIVQEGAAWLDPNGDRFPRLPIEVL